MNELSLEIDSIKKQIKANEDLLCIESNVDMQDLIKQEILDLTNHLVEMEKTKSVINGEFEKSKDNDDQNIDISPNIAILEIRAGTGGDEAGLFASDLLRMYIRYGEIHGWKSVELFKSENIAGGFKTVSVEIRGKDAY